MQTRGKWIVCVGIWNGCHAPNDDRGRQRFMVFRGQGQVLRAAVFGVLGAAPRVSFIKSSCLSARMIQRHSLRGRPFL